MSGNPPLAWCRLYADFPANFKVASLPEVMQARLVKCWCLHAAGHLVDTSLERLAFELRLSVAEVQETLATLTQAGLLEDDRTPHNWERRQHKSDHSAERQAAYRERKRDEQGRDVSVTSRSRDGDGGSDAQSRAEQSRTEQTAHGAESVPYAEIIEHLNQRTGASFRATTKATRAHIRARWNEGYRIEDFQAVIDAKAAEWLHGSIDGKPAAKYLRPQTLFGPNFESYREAARASGKRPHVADLPDANEVIAAMDREGRYV
jgi:uncharacterized phage protein (TIGR02220 family)